MDPERDTSHHDAVGENPVLEPGEFARSVREQFERDAQNIDSKTPATHEAGVKIGDKIIPVRELKIILREKGETIIKHKDEIIFYSAVGASAAGLFLMARDKLRTRKK